MPVAIHSQRWRVGLGASEFLGIGRSNLCKGLPLLLQLGKSSGRYSSKFFQTVPFGNLPWLGDLVCAKKPGRLLSVLTRAEVTELLGAIHDPDVVLPPRLLYGGARRQWAEGPGHDAAGKPGVADAGTDGIGKAAARERRCACPVC